MVKKKILIALGDVGYGHLAAAKAISYYFDTKYKNDIEYKIIDLLSDSKVWPFSNSDERYKFTSGSPLLLSLNNTIWKIFNTKVGFWFLRKFTVTRLKNSFRKIFEEEKPELVISTHFFVSMVLEEIKVKREIEFKSVTVLTDILTISRGWSDESADIIFCPNLEARDKLVSYGADSKKIKYPFFPIHPKFVSLKDKNLVYKELGLLPDKETILITGGGVGNKSLLSAIKQLAKNSDFQLIIISGRNKDVKKHLEKKFKKLNNIKVLGFADNMNDLMNASDVIFAKPGANTVMEILMLRKKAILSQYIGEQEVGNVDYALRSPLIRYIGNKKDNLYKSIKELIELDETKVDMKDAPIVNSNDSEVITDKIVDLLN